MPIDPAYTNRRWADLLVEELVRCSVTWFVLSPGSRSTPLVAAIASNPRARSIVHVDERGAAFAALGIARATGRPAAWVTTSGTAAANGLPAAVEASNDGVPLILLTADRPPELRDSGANQAIGQVGLFGRSVRWQVDLPVPDPAVDEAYVLTTVDQAVYRATSNDPGPVHVNCMFREPLVPGPGVVDDGLRPASTAAWRASPAPYTAYAPQDPRPDCAALAAALGGSSKVLIVAGRLDPRQAPAVASLACETGWPVFADICSQLRLDPAPGVSIVRYADLLTASPEALPTPDAVLYFGRPIVSKRVAGWLAAVRPAVFAVIADTPARIDPFHAATHRLTGIEGVCRALVSAFGRRQDTTPIDGPRDASEAGMPDADWAAPWLAADRRAAAVLDARLSGEELSEPKLARLLSMRIPPDHALVLASSMPIRDMDLFGSVRFGFSPADAVAAHATLEDSGPAGAHPPHAAQVAAAGVRELGSVPVFANRGTSGIDGTIATAAGIAAGLDRPVTLVIGDLAFQHDLNSLALLRDRRVIVVLINNDGGGIFSFLPIAQHEDVFEPYFGTPHGLTFGPAAALYGLAYEAPTNVPAFEAAYSAACARDGSSVIEVRTERRSNRTLHADLALAVSAAVRQP